MEEDSQSSQPLPIQQLSAPAPHDPTLLHNNRSIFTLPLEIRAKIYRYILISRLDCGSHPRLWRPVDVDGGISRIGYFERDTVMPLLHEEGAAILYGENTFAFHISGLASDGKIAFLENLGENYLQLLKRVYIRTGYGIDTYGFRSESHRVELQKDESPTLEQIQRKVDRDLATSISLLKEAWPARYRVYVDRDVTVDMQGEDDVKLLRKQKVVDWPASAFHLWRMFVVEGEDGEMRREFRRVRWKGVG